MSQEIKVINKVTVTNVTGIGEYSHTALYDQTTAGSWTATQSIATSETDLTWGGVGTVGFFIVQNTDAANFIDIGKKVGGVMEAICRLKPGMELIGYMSAGITLRAKADTAACVVRKWAAEA